MKEKFSISLDSELVKQLDAMAEVDHRTRNSMIEKLLSDAIKQELKEVES